MRESLLGQIRCPRCRAESGLELAPARCDAREVREGELRCAGCGAAYAIRNGVVDLLHAPPDFVVREAAGLARFAERMRADGWDRERILALPHEPSDYWFGQATAMEAVLASVAPRPGERVLDVGANTCWASNMLAEAGLEVVALDIAAVQMQGLETADWFFEAGGAHFERVLGLMFDVPLASESMDYVFCAQVLHHNDSSTLARTFEELYRVLRPGGRLLVVNEQLKFPLERKLDHGAEVEEYEGYEHVHFLHRYWLDARRAGFEVRLTEPADHHFFRGEHYVLAPETPTVTTLKRTGVQLARRSRLGRRLYLAYRTLLAGGVSLNMVCTKPADG